MKKRNAVCFREKLEQVPTQQLDEMLHNELRKDPIDERVVRMIMEVLGDRDAGEPIEMNSEISEAWGRYQAQAAALNKPAKESRMLLKVASVAVLVFALVSTIPQEAEAAGFFERIARWTDSIFELFTPGSAEAERPGYVFETDNPGLQEVYDKVTELGVTEPVVPMWLPEGYELVSCEVSQSPIKTGIVAAFSNGEDETIFYFDIYNNSIVSKYEKDKANVVEYELEEATYYIMRNKEKMGVAWTSTYVECSFITDCDENFIYVILDSIY